GLLPGQGSGGPGRQMLIAPHPELVGVDAELGRDLLQRLAVLRQQLHRLALELPCEPTSRLGQGAPSLNRSTLTTRPDRRGKLTPRWWTQISATTSPRSRTGR